MTGRVVLPYYWSVSKMNEGEKRQVPEMGRRMSAEFQNIMGTERRFRIIIQHVSFLYCNN